MNTALKYLVSILVGIIPVTFFKDELHTFLNSVEKKIKESPSQYDDLALPIIAIIRQQLSI